MPSISYESIEPILTRTHQRGEVLVCTFTCPVTGSAYEGVGLLEKGRSIEDVSTQSPTLLGSLRATIGSLLRGALGDARPEPSADAGESGPAFTEGERRAAALLAFQGIATRFVRDGKNERWVAAEGVGDLLTEFSRQLGVAPVSERRDRMVLSRMLVEVARVDGHVTPTEWAFLAEFIPPDLSSIDTFMEKPALTPGELNQTSKGASRDTMLMLAWAAALTDQELEEHETEQLLTYADGLRVPRDRAVELKCIAQRYLVDEAFSRAYGKGKPDASLRAEAVALGERLGMSREQIAEAEALFKKRNGFS